MIRSTSLLPMAPLLVGAIMSAVQLLATSADLIGWTITQFDR